MGLSDEAVVEANVRAVCRVCCASAGRLSVVCSQASKKGGEAGVVICARCVTASTTCVGRLVPADWVATWAFQPRRPMMICTRPEPTLSAFRARLEPATVAPVLLDSALVGFGLVGEESKWRDGDLTKHSRAVPSQVPTHGREI